MTRYLFGFLLIAGIAWGQADRKPPYCRDAFVRPPSGKAPVKHNAYYWKIAIYESRTCGKAIYVIDVSRLLPVESGTYECATIKLVGKTSALVESCDVPGYPNLLRDLGTSVVN